ncbi:MAG: protein kinase [Gordonia sp. (in: high G+C Gram-positive bacteria)]
MAKPPVHVFISHSSEDATIAAEVRMAFLARGIRAAVRGEPTVTGDTEPGAKTTRLGKCAVLVALLSASAANSPDIVGELVQAAADDTPIIGFTLDIANLRELPERLAAIPVTPFPGPEQVVDVICEQYFDGADSPTVQHADSPTAMPPAAAGSQILRPGAVLDNYTIQRRLAAGGMGVVYLATNPSVQRTEALKVLPNYRSVDQQMHTRFLREARLAGRLNHPNIVSVYDCGESPDHLWIAMQYVDGQNAAEFSGGRLPLADCLWILHDVASALDYAHLQNVLHRDVKPANILLDLKCSPRRALLADFGIAHAIGSPMLTAPGQAVGTVAFMSPEHLGDRAMDGRSDVYSLACTVYALTTGTSPFTGVPAQIADGHAHREPPRLSSRLAGVPPAVDDVLGTALAKAPDRRFPSAGAFVAALARAENTPRSPQPLIQQKPPRPRPARRRSGTVKWWQSIDRYGVIVPDDGGPQVFARRAALGAGITALVKGQRVEFETEQTPDCPSALRITILPQAPPP